MRLRRPPLVSLAGLLGWLLLCYATAAVGALASVQARAFYAELALPPWAPPGWVFGPVWSLLYTLMAVSAWLVWKDRGFGGARAALGLFLAQLAANALWSWLFFAWRRGALATAEILLLDALVLATVVAFRRHRPLAAALLLPYLAWIAFATVLCLTLWRTNPALLG
ncbi:MAG TPA: TspO/MBR family protein [Holophagaceae bacterium]|nr:TspO/MBR family protein [Holophagaceae bacterium]